jgi:hypothetical protein
MERGSRLAESVAQTATLGHRGTERRSKKVKEVEEIEGARERTSGAKCRASLRVLNA